MFCTSLRRRSSFASIVPLLVSPSGFAVKESSLESHDIALPLVEFPRTNTVTKSKRSLRLLLLSPNNMSEERLSATIERIQHFIALTGGLDVAIVLSLSTSKPFSPAKDLLHAPEVDDMDGLRSYALLQAQFMTRPELAWVPILPLTKLDGIVELIKTHAQSISRPKPKPSSAIRPLDMLAHCSCDPLPPLAVNLASDVFSSLSDVAQAALAHHGDPTVHDSGGVTSSDDSLRSDRYGFTVLEEQLDTKVIESMVDFWAGDWSVD
ncbi:hypothetical protein E4T44_09295 [Aureobasidium sp. EXF-8845]|nr:hypothetical protein E4T44_09295 [Aureobasidium sp. EXF-8845]KAI4836931.1 hypothetical protein E4T45_09852 [Aureobasidium sp. EXF-8846]